MRRRVCRGLPVPDQFKSQRSSEVIQFSLQTKHHLVKGCKARRDDEAHNEQTSANTGIEKSHSWAKQLANELANGQRSAELGDFCDKNRSRPRISIGILPPAVHGILGLAKTSQLLIYKLHHFTRHETRCHKARALSWPKLSAGHGVEAPKLTPQGPDRRRSSGLMVVAISIAAIAQLCQCPVAFTGPLSGLFPSFASLLLRHSEPSAKQNPCGHSHRCNMAYQCIPHDSDVLKRCVLDW